MDTLIGQVLSEKYLLTELLGEGGLGQVYLARALPDGERCALKVLHAELSDDPRLVSRFEQEAVAALRVTHPGSVRFLDFGAFDTPTGRAPFLVMEYLPGETLYHRLQQRGRLSLEEAVDTLRALLEVLACLHDQGILHRDLKPENLMLVPTPEGEQLKLLDFGVAKLLDAPGLTRTGQMMGTPYYMAPEQIDGRKTIGAPADLYAVGVMAFELLTGEVPFRAASHLDVFRMHFTDAPPSLQSRLGDLFAVAPFEPVLQKALAKDPADRYPTAEAFSQALTAALQASQQAKRATRGGRGSVAGALPPTSRHVPPRLVAKEVARPFEAEESGVETRGAFEAPFAAGAKEGAARVAAEAGVPARASASRALGPPLAEAGDDDQGDAWATAVVPPNAPRPWEDDVSAETAAVLLVEATVRMTPLLAAPHPQGSPEATVKMAALPAFLWGEEGTQVFELGEEGTQVLEAGPGRAAPPPAETRADLARQTERATPPKTRGPGRWRAFVAALLRALPASQALARWLSRHRAPRRLAN